MQRFDPFRALDEGARNAELNAHRAMMAERDGGLDLECRRLSGREASCIRLDATPVRWLGTLDRPSFVRNLGGDPSPVEDARVAWLLAAAKSVEQEGYGVDLELKTLARGDADTIDEQRLRIALQDRHHTRLLERAFRVFGIQLRPRAPGLPSRLVMHLARLLPESLRAASRLCSDVVDAVFVGILLDRCDLFRDQPEVEQRLRLLVEEMLVDETGHVAFSRARIHRSLLPLARALAPRVAARALRSVPEFAALAGGRAEVLRRVRAHLPLPEPVDWISREEGTS